jgi:hypothetical protein
MHARMSSPRTFRLPLVVLAALIGWLVIAPAAEAQVFKPRGRTAATGKAGSAARKAAPAAATPAKKPARATATAPRRATIAPKGKNAGKNAKARAGQADQDDDVKIEDEDDDVKITDD